jgi:hypothetical protein
VAKKDGLKMRMANEREEKKVLLQMTMTSVVSEYP